ncbi:sensor histidine kinase [Thalassobacillus sp. B23F22_16]|uniref:sensor histidine kinase n=1 Tax=Thalassobacillus sp. B23F22_16 TaxID=3459513 RepID=UPI00373F2E91
MKTLYSRFLIVTLLIITGSTIIGFLFSNSYYHQKVKPENDEKNMEIITGIASFAENQDDLDSYLVQMGSAGYQLYLVDSSGRGKFYGGEFRDKQLPESIVEQVLAGNEYHGMRNFPRETFVSGFFADELRNTVGTSFDYNGERYALFMRPDIELLFSEVHILLGWIVVIMLVLTIVAVLIAARMLVNPIRKLSNATHKVVDENFDVQLDIQRTDEIGQLADRFNHMTRRLGELDAMRKSFISNVSHDIQSPLLNIQGYARLLENDSLTSEEKQDYINVIKDETERMSMLSKQLLVLTSLDQKGKLEKKEAVDVTAQLKETIHKYRWLFEEKDLFVTYDLEEAVLSGDEAMLYAVWENLLTNAIKYNRPDGSIEISLKNKADEVAIEFRDTGIGMTPEEQELIFERFYRADEARTTEGTGLGLSIVNQVIDMHGGTITVESEQDAGTSFFVVLPKK